jgi:acetyl-CoA decarbonylase/synthase complex subunit delta
MGEKEKGEATNLHLKLLELINQLGERELELQDVDLEAQEIEIMLQPLMRALRVPSVKPLIAKPKVAEYQQLKFEPPLETYTGQIVEVRIGATKSEGGTRSKSVKIGGEQAPPYYRFERPLKNKPVISLDIFDMPISLAKPVKAHYAEVLNDPAEWAKLGVQKYGADMIALHLISTDPGIKDTTPQEAAKTLENVLQAVDVPIIIGGSGNPDKDPAVFEKASEAAQGERCLINSANLSMDYKKIASDAKKNGHVVISFTQLDVNNQRKLNRYLFDAGLSKEEIVQDPTTAALGYGLEYSFSTMERIRLAALRGDQDLNMPMSSGTTNAWGAREAHKKNPDWGPVEYRGPLWETITGLTLLLAGCDLFMMMHPMAAKTLKTIIEYLTSPEKTNPYNFADWVSMKI